MKGGSSAPDDSIITVAETVASSIKKNHLWSHGFRASPQSCIFTVPESLSTHNKAAYKPTTFSIGPLHHSDEHLKHSQTIKFQYLRDLVDRVSVQVQGLTTDVAKLELKARKHYGEKIDFSSAEFVEIMVIDGCFLIEFFRKLAGTVGREPNDPLFSMNNLQLELVHDIMLLENQIPWRVLGRLFTKTRGGERLNQESSLLDHALYFLHRKSIFSGVNFPKKNRKPKNCRHILELARHVLIQTTKVENVGVTPKKSEASGLYDLEAETGPDDEIFIAAEGTAALENSGVTMKKGESSGLYDLEADTGPQIVSILATAALENSGVTMKKSESSGLYDLEAKTGPQDEICILLGEAAPENAGVTLKKSKTSGLYDLEAETGPNDEILIASSAIAAPENSGVIMKNSEASELYDIEAETDPKWKTIPTAVELENFGVTLKKSEAHGLTILFDDGVLEISPFHIYDGTESLFRNIIALEQCSSENYTTFLSSYVYVLNDLIKTTKDINCLSSNDIIKVNINPDDALGFFNKVANGVIAREFYYTNISPPLNAYCQRRWPKWRAMLYRNYFSNPWVIISTFAAFVLLILTWLQTIYAMK